MIRFVAVIFTLFFCALPAAYPQSKSNIFLTTEKPLLTVSNNLADGITWTVTDFWGKEVDSGKSSFNEGKAVIEPNVSDPGYFTAAWEIHSGSTLLSRGGTTFAILTPFDLANVKDSPFGLMTHFAQNWDRDLIPIIARGGIKNIRDEIYWADVEKKKGTYGFLQKYEAYMADVKANHLEPLIVLSFGNPNYDYTPKAPSYGNAPYTDEGRAGYARYSEELLKHYGDQLKAVEVWNEYNGTFGKGPAAKDKPGNYFEMLKVAHEAIRRQRPDITIVGISAVSTPFPYFEDLFKRGALQYMDAISFHPYRTHSTPEGLEPLIAKLQKLVKKYNDGQSKPLWITELGWYVKKNDDNSGVVVTESDQAKYLVRAVTLCIGGGVEKYYWYLARDDKHFPASGVLRSPEDPLGRYAPKPAFVAYATLARALADATFEKRERTVGEDVYSMLFKRGDDEVRVMWSLAPCELPVKTSKSLTITDLVGGIRTVEPKKDSVTLSLTDTPIYVTGPLTDLPPEKKEAGEVIANSDEGFSSEQGTDGWSYGTFETPPGGSYDPAAWTPLPKYNVTIWGYEWLGSGRYPFITPANAHPASTKDQKQIWAVRRWTSNLEGKLRIKGEFSRPTSGDGTTARIFVDGKEVWSQQVGGGKPNTVKCDVRTQVKTGSLVDISIDPGPTLDMSNDATMTNVTLIRLPESQE
ncbi:MAG TPA: hypothetical protein VIT91_13670 [Chthoniobacterales bacterium]